MNPNPSANRDLAGSIAWGAFVLIGGGILVKAFMSILSLLAG